MLREKTSESSVRLLFISQCPQPSAKKAKAFFFFLMQHNGGSGFFQTRTSGAVSTHKGGQARGGPRGVALKLAGQRLGPRGPRARFRGGGEAGLAAVPGPLPSTAAVETRGGRAGPTATRRDAGGPREGTPCPLTSVAATHTHTHTHIHPPTPRRGNLRTRGGGAGSVRLALRMLRPGSRKWRAGHAQ